MLVGVLGALLSALGTLLVLRTRLDFLRKLDARWRKRRRARFDEGASWRKASY